MSQGAPAPGDEGPALTLALDRVWRQPSPLEGEVVESTGMLARWCGDWDALAVQAGQPYCSPGWMLAWWRHVAPAGARLRVALARRGDELLGVAPFFLDRGHGGLARYRSLGAGTSMRIEPVARRGMEGPVAATFSRLLGRCRPVPDVVMFEGVPSSSPWPRLFAAALPGETGPWVHLDVSRPAPTLSLEGRTFEGWMTSRSRNFRGQMRRARRQLEAEGAVFRLSGVGEPEVGGSSTLVADVAALAELHRARWEWRGGSAVLESGVEAMLEQAARSLGPSRFRLWIIELGRRPISAHLFLAAGGQVSYWLGGFDEGWARQHPSMLGLLSAVEQGWELGDRRVDFGGGAQPYKYRFADGEELLHWITLVPRGSRYLRTRLGLLPKHAYRFVSDRLPESTRERFRGMLPGLGWIR